MDRYRILKQGVFERTSVFEAGLNRFCNQGWQAISISTDGTRSFVLLERRER